VKAGQTYMLSDDDLAEKVKKEVAEMDRQNKICEKGSKYTKRLLNLTKGIKDANGINLISKCIRQKS